MKKVLLLLAVTLAFTLTALAQTDTSTSGGASGQTTTTTTKTKKSKKTAASDESGAAKGEHQHAAGKAKKEASLTGCVSAQPDANGNYTLSNGRYKKGVEISPADKVKDHAGHQVQLKGEWKAAAAGETAGGGTKAAAKSKSFEVASVNHLADTCSQAAGGGTTAPTKKGAKDKKKGKDTVATPPGLY